MQFFKKGQWIDLLQNLAVMLLYIVFAKIGLLLAIAEPTVTIFWPASGLALAVILIAGLNYLPGIFLGALIAALMVENTLQLSVLTALCSALEAFFGYWLLTRIRQVDISLTHTQDFFLLILYGAVLSTLASASIRLVAVATLYDHTINQLLGLSLHWWAADALGIAIMTPLILIWSSKKSWKVKPLKSLEISVLFVLTFFVGQVVFFKWSQSLPNLTLGSAWILSFILWSASRCGSGITALLQLMIFIQVLLSISLGMGYYPEGIVKDDIFNFWMFSMLMAYGSMTLAIANSESKKSLTELRVNKKHHLPIKYMVSTNSGGWRWLNSVGRVFECGVNGEPLKMVGTHDQKLVMDALNASQYDLKEVQRIAHIGNWKLDLMRDELVWSDEIYNIFEIDKTKYQPSYQSFLALVHPEDRNMVNAAYSQSVETSAPYTISHRLCMGDGRIKYVNEIGETYYDQYGAPFLSAGIVQDITSHKVAEEALKVEERHLQAVLNNISDCVKMISRNGALLSINTAGLALIEADSTDSIIGKCIYPSVVPEHRESFQSFNERVCDGVSGEMEFEIIGLKGTRRWMETHAVPFTISPSGEIVHLAYTQNITKRKQVEDQLILSTLSTERTLQEQRQFMAMLSHELKTPLSIIRMALGMEEISQSQKRNAKQAVLDIDAITKRCLQADQIDQRQLKPTLQPCQINDMLESLIAEQHHRLNFQSAQLPVINSDHQLLHVILNNLVDNALKYSDSQSIVKITTSLVNLNAKEYVLVSFVNSPGGAGMPDPKRVFEKYYRSPGAHSQSGSGLGLYIVHSMTQLLGGCVRYSAAEKEVRFELCIPL